MVDVFTYLVELPDQIEEMVVPCLDGYTVYIDANLTAERRVSAFRHALRHILRGDFEKPDAGEIEVEAHAQTPQQLWNDIQAVRITEKSVDSTEAGWQGS